ncbi:MAG: winged helix-turn-helix transcriptional regulator [Congregibacter sp.]
MDIKSLVKITSRAWSLDILALLDSGVAGRQAPLLAATEANRTAFAKSLSHLIDLGLLQRNPGHGHPLRPEYRLTATGIEIARVAGNLVRAVPSDAEFAPLRRCWTLPILSVTAAPRRFTEIKTDLLSVSDRALSQSLGQLQEINWLQREVDSAVRPPRPTYQAASIGLTLCQTVNGGSAIN